MIIWDSETDASQPTSAQTIILRKGAHTWMADFSQTQHAAFLRSTFGSSIMALEFPCYGPAGVDAVEIFNLIKARNPEYVIHVA